MDPNTGPDWLLIVIAAVVLSAPGLVMLLAPVDWLLSLDRRVGFQLFRRAPDPETGRNRARLFYRLLGLVLLVCLLPLLQSLL